VVLKCAAFEFSSYVRVTLAKELKIVLFTLKTYIRFISGGIVVIILCLVTIFCQRSDVEKY